MMRKSDRVARLSCSSCRSTRTRVPPLYSLPSRPHTRTPTYISRRSIARTVPADQNRPRQLHATSRVPITGVTITLPEDVLAEVKRRDDPAHHYFMNRRLDHDDLDKDVRRLEMIQTLLVALTAVHVGYTRPIRGYDVTPSGGRSAPTWWPVNAPSLAGPIQYRGSADSHLVRSRELAGSARQRTAHRELPHKLVKACALGRNKIRVMDLERGYEEPGWCTKGHLLYVLEGTLILHFDDETLELGPGDVADLPAGNFHRHRPEPAGEKVRSLLVEDA